MEARILQNAIFFLFPIFLFSPPMVITAQRDTPTGNIPIVNPTTPGTTPIVNPTNPTTPGTTPIVNPTNPQTPTFTVPPTTMSPPTFTVPPTTTSPPTTTGPPTTSGGGSWCVASASTSEMALQVALDYACGYGGADCSALQPNGACYDPNTIRDHASYAFNDYYQKNPGPTSCVFGGAAQLTNTDPSHGNCRFASSSGNSMTPPRTNPPPTFSMPPPSPSTTTPPFNPYPPAGNGNGGIEPPGSGYDYGSEPTGTPSSSGTISLNLVLLITMNCLIFSVSIANHF